ncbi:MAG: tail fiber protein [Methylobacter sp.]|nr:tail fiber protein [Methylococcales bacterium]MDD5112540.1 tail fiber protein [Methylobacter sp.]
MSDPFVGEIRMFGFNWAPKGWASCIGQTLVISQNQALYALLGVQFGGNGTTNFNLPDFRGRMPIHAGIHSGQNYIQGTVGGSDTVTLANTNLPQHTHAMNAVSTLGTAFAFPAPVVFAASQESTYINTGTYVALNPGTCSNSGGSQAHTNIQPSLCIGFCIALQGFFPARN